MLVYSRSTGVEELLDTVEKILIRDLNDALDEVYLRLEDSDAERALRRGLPYSAITYDYVPPGHFHTGNFPSLVLEEVPKEDYPYVVLTIEDFVPDPEDARHDEMSVLRDALVVHSLARADPEEGSEVVFRRAVRMGEAVHLSLASSPELRKALAQFSNPVRGQASVPWTSQYQGHGENWWFQAVGLSYAIKSYSSIYE